MMATCSNPVFSWQRPQRTMQQTIGNRQIYPAGTTRLARHNPFYSTKNIQIYNEGNQS